MGLLEENELLVVVMFIKVLEVLSGGKVGSVRYISEMQVLIAESTGYCSHRDLHGTTANILTLHMCR